MDIFDELNLLESFNDNIEKTLELSDSLSIYYSDNLELNSVQNIEILDVLTVNLEDNFIHHIKISDELCRLGKQYTYSEILNKFRDLSQIVDNFLPDWYTLRYLQKESILDRASIARVAVALSNLFRLAVDNEIDEIHLVTLRIRKMFIEEINKDVFIITDY
jgi:hypothetical protein